jgi:hypothetical protein
MLGLLCCYCVREGMADCMVECWQVDRGCNQPTLAELHLKLCHAVDTTEMACTSQLALWVLLLLLLSHRYQSCCQAVACS